MANPKRTIESYYTESFITKQSEKNDRLYGPVECHKKNCTICGNEYEIIGRKKTKKIQNSKYCGRSCANHRGKGLEWEKNHPNRFLSNYRTICFTEWDESCVVCGYYKIVDVHHIDEDRKNNNVKNLIPLCPNHHMELHNKKYGDEIKKIINEKYADKWGIGIVG